MLAAKDSQNYLKLTLFFIAACNASLPRVVLTRRNEIWKAQEQGINTATMPKYPGTLETETATMHGVPIGCKVWRAGQRGDFAYRITRERQT